MIYWLLVSFSSCISIIASFIKETSFNLSILDSSKLISSLHPSNLIKSFAISLAIGAGMQTLLVSLFTVKGRVVAVCEKVFQLRIRKLVNSNNFFICSLFYNCYCFIYMMNIVINSYYFFSN